MEKAKLVIEVIRKLIKVAEDLKILSDSMKDACNKAMEFLPKETNAEHILPSAATTMMVQACMMGVG